jgi:DNA-binding MarR family transcriptional regulator
VISLISKTNGGFLVTKIKQIQGRVFEKLLAEHGIDQFNGAQGRILFVLWTDDNVPIHELSNKTGLAKTTLTSMLDRLEQAGHIQRVFDPHDRRKINIRLTDAAKSLKGRYEEVSMRMNEIFYQGFTDQEITAFEEQLGRILDNLAGGNEDHD